MHAWGDILRLSAEYLVQKGVPDAQVAAELLVARLLKCGRGFLSPHLEETPDAKYVEAMRRGIARLGAGEPIQYVLGEWDFRSLTLKCDRRALIPRPETEELVTRVLKFAKTYAVPRPFVVDVGTGSGCIILSLAKEMADGVFLGIDISADAVSLAQEIHLPIHTFTILSVLFPSQSTLLPLSLPRSSLILPSPPSPYILFMSSITAESSSPISHSDEIGRAHV